MVKVFALPLNVLSAAVLVVTPVLLSADAIGDAAVVKFEKSAVPTAAEKDSDRDGIKDALEEKFTLNVKDPADALLDTDGDGFANLWEVEYGFDPTDPIDHPPLWWRLQVQGIRYVEMVRLISFNDGGHTDKNRWSAQIAVADRGKNGKNREFTVEIGGWITFKNRRYKVSNMEKFSDSARVILTELTVKGKNPQVIELESDKPYCEDYAVLLDTGDPKRREYVVARGEKLYIGLFAAYDKDGKEYLNAAGRRAQVRAYTVSDVDRRSLTVTVREYGKKGKGAELEITPEGKIVFDRRPLKK